jgi:hypothetical protein
LLIEQLPLDQLQSRQQQLLEQLEQLLHQPQSACFAEDIFAVLSALLDRVSGDRLPVAVSSLLYGRLLPVLTAQFFSAPSAGDNTTLLAAVGLTGDIYRIMAGNNAAADGFIGMLDHETVVTALIGHLQCPDCSQGLVIASFGALADIALCLRTGFRPYAETILRMLSHAGHWEALAPNSAGEGGTGLIELHKCLADTYSAILQALKHNADNDVMENDDNDSNNSILETALPGMLALLDRTVNQNGGQPINDDLLLSLCGLIGDMYQVLFTILILIRLIYPPLMFFHCFKIR